MFEQDGISEMCSCSGGFWSEQQKFAARVQRSVSESTASLHFSPHTQDHSAIWRCGESIVARLDEARREGVVKRCYCRGNAAQSNIAARGPPCIHRCPSSSTACIHHELELPLPLASLEKPPREHHEKVGVGFRSPASQGITSLTRPKGPTVPYSNLAAMSKVFRVMEICDASPALTSTSPTVPHAILVSLPLEFRLWRCALKGHPNRILFTRALAPQARQCCRELLEDFSSPNQDCRKGSRKVVGHGGPSILLISAAYRAPSSAAAASLVSIRLCHITLDNSIDELRMVHLGQPPPEGCQKDRRPSDRHPDLIHRITAVRPHSDLGIDECVRGSVGAVQCHQARQSLLNPSELDGVQLVGLESPHCEMRMHTRPDHLLPQLARLDWVVLTRQSIPRSMAEADGVIICWSLTFAVASPPVDQEYPLVSDAASPRQHHAGAQRSCFTSPSFLHQCFPFNQETIPSPGRDQLPAKALSGFSLQIRSCNTTKPASLTSSKPYNGTCTPSQTIAARSCRLELEWSDGTMRYDQTWPVNIQRSRATVSIADITTLPPSLQHPSLQHLSPLKARFTSRTQRYRAPIISMSRDQRYRPPEGEYGPATHSQYAYNEHKLWRCSERERSLLAAFYQRSMLETLSSRDKEVRMVIFAGIGHHTKAVWVYSGESAKFLLPKICQQTSQPIARIHTMNADGIFTDWESEEDDDNSCPICAEDLTGKDNTFILESRYCNDCAKPYLTKKIQDAIKNEIYYPLSEGRDPLYIEDFRALIDDNDLYQLYYERAEDYAVPVSERRYCKHRIRVGDRPRNPYADENPKTWIPPVALGVETEPCGHQLRGMEDEEIPSCSCSSCAGLSCLNCFEPTYGVRVPHRCLLMEVEEEEAQAEIDGLEGQVRGKDYQLCPEADCRVPVYLGEACNHMVCPRPVCRTDFCFVCGEQVLSMAEQHWGDREGQCPWYGQPPGPRRRRLVRRELQPWENPRLVFIEEEQPEPGPERTGYFPERFERGDRFLRFPNIPPPDPRAPWIVPAISTMRAAGFGDVLGISDARLLEETMGSRPRKRYRNRGRDIQRLQAMLAVCLMRSLISNEEVIAMVDQLRKEGPSPLFIWNLNAQGVIEEMNKGQPWDEEEKIQDPRNLEILLSRGMELGMWDQLRADEIFEANYMRLARRFVVQTFRRGPQSRVVEWPLPTDDFPLRVGDCEPPRWFFDLENQERRMVQLNSWLEDAVFWTCRLVWLEVGPSARAWGSEE
ncbi:uncharacterized protein MYCFIDRAFT_177552 [Pseudocercospora fijiensis CIRAD86]|uniref:RBR-type E3 ubiquitin transferase n=1 Tax=Pseudocercospora fijiensis (strain CIRAD86) TaxID=383855 RepID=M3AT05_PSEFD|nr:uncharacterized protein MYCFIDRAFT_177552 [Pseudocercospora fijiensis CIRAD86]EME80622.1 hypothetical protein MYCFIDRAFT_177552 [Pseudocercospora fijiensis CIRAD86]